ncbi:DUF4254 domain-containing protein [Actinokineospora sp.]|uniref:DUF4254 domain-containing protein n=1 Tax=Actinokineospora sp. TaxID=1872133 RepID=UPI0040376457
MTTAIGDKVAAEPLDDHPTPPKANVVVRAFTSTPAEHPVLTPAAGLATHHWLRAEAQHLTCDPHADEHVVAAATRAINAADAARAVLIDRIDVWAATDLTEHRIGRLHTETLGQLVDRVACAWMRWHLLDNADNDAGAVARAQIHLAWHQLGELATAYDDLLADLRTGSRCLPRYQTLAGPAAAT